MTNQQSNEDMIVLNNRPSTSSPSHLYSCDKTSTQRKHSSEYFNYRLDEKSWAEYRLQQLKKRVEFLKKQRQLAGFTDEVYSRN